MHELIDDESGEDDSEEVFPEGWDDDDDEPSVICQSCGAPMLEVATQCPACGQWQTREEGSVPRATWIMLTAILCILLTLFWLL